jgi:hypothetical protein
MGHLQYEPGLEKADKLLCKDRFLNTFQKAVWHLQGGVFIKKTI